MRRTLELQVPEHLFLKTLKMKRLQGFNDDDWEPWLAHLTSDITLDDTPEEMIQRNTRVNLLKTWCQNLAENIPDIRSGNHIRDLAPPQAEVDDTYISGPALIIGRGPSMYAKKHLELLAEKGFGGKIIATDGALLDCLKRGVVPHYALSVDGHRELIRKWYDHPLVAEHASEIKVLLCVTVAHNVYTCCRDAGLQVYWFNPQFDDYRRNESFTKLQMLMTSTDKYPNGAANVSAGGNCGTTSWVVAGSLLRCSPIGLIGIEFGYPPDMALEETSYYKALMEGTGGNVEIVKQAYQKVYNPFFKCSALVDLVFKQYRDAFLDLLRTGMPPWIKTVNCTEAGSLFTEDPSLGLEYSGFSEFLDKYPPRKEA